MAQVRRREAGQALVVAALSLAVLMLAAGLSIDMGYLRYEKRKMQSAADAAAIAGADELRFGIFRYATAAYAAAAANGFTDVSLGGAANVSPENGPQDGPHLNDNRFVEVVITQNQPTFFMRVFGIGSEPVSARAVAGLRGSPECIFALGPNGLNLTGSSGLPGVVGTSFESQTTGNGCGVIDNGPLTLQNYSSDKLTASFVGVDGSCTVLDTGSCPGIVTPNPQPIVPSADPLAYVTPPGSAGTCSGTAVTYSSGTVPTSLANCGIIVTGGSVTFNPGTYYGIQITGSANVTFNPGVYTLASTNGNVPANGSPFSCITTCTALFITGNSNTITGAGVSFYNTSGSIIMCTAYNDTSGNDGTGCPDWGGATTVSLSAPTSGTDAGLLFYQDRANTSPAIIAGNDDIYGQSTTSMEGIFYFPSATLNLYDLTDSTNAYTILDAYQVNLLGQVIIGIGSHYNSLQPAPLRAAYLSE